MLLLALRSALYVFHATPADDKMLCNHLLILDIVIEQLALSFVIYAGEGLLVAEHDPVKLALVDSLVLLNLLMMIIRLLVMLDHLRRTQLGLGWLRTTLIIPIVEYRRWSALVQLLSFGCAGCALTTTEEPIDPRRSAPLTGLLSSCLGRSYHPLIRRLSCCLGTNTFLV